MFAIACFIVALLLFLLAAFANPAPARPQLVPLGLAFVVAGLLVPMLN